MNVIDELIFIILYNNNFFLLLKEFSHDPKTMTWRCTLPDYSQPSPIETSANHISCAFLRSETTPRSSGLLSLYITCRKQGKANSDAFKNKLKSNNFIDQPCL